VTGRLKLSSSTSSTVIRVAPGRREDLRLQHSTGPKIGGYQWFVSDGDMGEQVRRRQVPIIGSGQGVSIWVHIDDAAEATVRALDCAPGPYNIVDDSPCEQRMWLTAFARYCGAPEPPHVCEQEALQAAGADAVYYATRLRGASNAKAKRDLGFRPRPLAWLFDTAGTTEG